MILVIILYLLSRLINLSLLPFFTDESSYIYTARLVQENIINNWDLSLNLPIVKPPLFFLLQIIFKERLISVISGGLTVLGLYLLTKKLFNKKTAYLASLLYILSPFTLTYDRLALMDSMMGTFSVWILFITLKIINMGKVKDVCILIALCILSLLTKQSGKFFLFMLPIISLILKKYTKLFLFISILSYGIYLLIMARSNNFDFYNNFDKNYINFSLPVIINNLKAVLSWIKSYFPVIYLLIPFSVIYALKKDFKKGSALSFWISAPILVSALVGQYFFPRYLLPSIILVFPLLALLINKYKLLLLIIIPSLIFDYYILFNPVKAPYHYNERDQFISGWPSGYGVLEAFNKLQELGNNEKVLIEGNNGHLKNTFSLINKNMKFFSFEQNLIYEDIEKYLPSYDYLVTNRIHNFKDKNKLIPIWKFQKPSDGILIIIYQIAHNK